MIPLLATAGISLGSQLLKALLGKGESEYKMSHQEQEVFNMLMEGARGNVPSSVTAPFLGEAKKYEQSMARHPGMMGTTSAVKNRQFLHPMSEAIKSYKLGAAGQAAQLAKGTGHMTTPTDWGGMAEGMGGDMAFILALMQAMK